jgi:hypothetical protein
MTNTTTATGIPLLPSVELAWPCCQIVIDTRQDYLEVSVCVTIHVGLDNGIPPILEPSDPVGDDARILTTEPKCLVSASLELR